MERSFAALVVCDAAHVETLNVPLEIWYYLVIVFLRFPAIFERIRASCISCQELLAETRLDEEGLGQVRVEHVSSLQAEIRSYLLNHEERMALANNDPLHGHAGLTRQDRAFCLPRACDAILRFRAMG